MGNPSLTAKPPGSKPPIKGKLIFLKVFHTFPIQCNNSRKPKPQEYASPRTPSCILLFSFCLVFSSLFGFSDNTMAEDAQDKCTQRGRPSWQFRRFASEDLQLELARVLRTELGSMGRLTGVQRGARERFRRRVKGWAMEGHQARKGERWGRGGGGLELGVRGLEWSHYLSV